MPLSATLALRLEAAFSKTLEFGSSPTALHQLIRNFSLSDGVAAGQADRVFADQRTLGAGTNEDLDLSGSLLDVYGAAFTLARLKVFAVACPSTNPNNMTITRPANGVPWLAASTDAIVIAPGEVKLLVCRTDATGIIVTAATGDLINFLAGAGGNHVYDVLFIGTSS